MKLLAKRFGLPCIVLLSVTVLARADAKTATPSLPFEKNVLEVNVPSDPMSWFGTATREDIGHVLDHVAMPPSDPRKTFEAHKGKKLGKKTAFTLKTPTAGTCVFAYSVMTNKNKSVIGRYRSGEDWVDLPPGRIQPDYFQSWDMREFCYWIEIPAGQTETDFEFTVTTVSAPTGPKGDPYSAPGLHAALISEPRVDPFEGMPGGTHPMFDIPDIEEWGKTELGKAVLRGAGIRNAPKPLSDDAFEKRKANLVKYEKMSYYHLINSGNAWGIAKDGLNYRLTGDAKYARLAGIKARGVGSWPTWGYVQEWNVDMDEWAGPGHENFRKWGPFVRNHTLQSSIMTQAMAVTYDLACDGMAPADRQAFRKALDHKAHLMYVRSLLSPWNTYHHDNWSGHLLSCLGLAGAALSGEDRYAAEWLERFQTALPYYVVDLVDDNGLHRELMHYSCFGLNPLMLAGIAAERRGGPSPFQWADDRMEKFLTTMLYFASPNGKAMRDFGQGGGALQMTSSGGLGGRTATMLAMMTRGPRGDLARWMALRGTQRYKDSQGEHNLLNAQEGIMNLLLYRPGPQKSPAEYGDYPLGWHERCPIGYPYDNGYVVMRTGFDSPDDIKMVVKCGNAAGGHGQPCQGSFVLDAYGDFLSQSPGYNNWGGRTEAHNLITIDGRGQAEGHTWGSGRKDNDGHIERFVHSTAADLVIANNKPAYDGGKNPVARSLRYFLFVRKPDRRGYFVVVDDMVTDGAQHEYTWHFHTTLDHRIEPDGESAFVAKGITKAEGIDLWTQRGEAGIAKRFKKTGPTERHPWVKEVIVDLRLEMVWPGKFTHKITFNEKDYGKKRINVPDHLQVVHKGVDPVFFTILYPERKDLGIKMPAVKKIVAGDLWGYTMGEDTVLFSRREGTWKHGDIETDARLVYVRRDDGGKVTAFAVGEATTLKVAGKKLFASEQKVTAAGPEPQIVTDDGGAWRATSAKRGMPLD